MDNLDFKIQIICDISFLNEKAILLNDLPKDEESLSTIRKSLNDSLKKEDFDNPILYRQNELAKSLFLTIKDLKRWVEEDIYLSWEEDDTNFLNFLLHSRWLYKREMFDLYRDYLSLLFKDVLTPLFMKTTHNDQFFNDMSYWFVTEGDNLFNRLKLEEERKELLDHFEGENLAK